MGLKKKFQLIYKNRGLQGFASIYIPYLVIGLLLIIQLKHGDIVLFINKYSKEEWDGTMNFITDLGLGSVIAAFWILFSLIRFRFALMGLFNLGLVGIFTGVLKNLFKASHIRPFNYFYYDDFPRFIYTVELNYFSSFPSGHTMSIFATMSILAYFIGKRGIGFALFFVALLIGFSRIYLCQHFFLDVYAGSVIGLICTSLTIWIGDGLLGLHQRDLLQKPIYRISVKRKTTSL